MDEQITISTPEQVAFHYEMAGIGSRFVASLLDHLILVVAMVLVYCAMFSLLFGGLFSGSQSGEEFGFGLLAVLVLVEFLIFWGYFVLFELVWNGQTPGKRAGKLRVIRRDGQPVHAGEVMIRNLVRIVDFLPGFYGIGLVTMFIDKDARRLGDMAAGTIVVREGEQTRLRDVQVAQPQQQAMQASYTTSLYGSQEQAQPVGSYQPYGSYGQPSSGGYEVPPPAMPKYDPLPGISLRDVTQDDYRLIREVLQRVSRGELAADRANDLSQRLAYGVAARMGQDFREWQGQGWDPLVFLQSVIDAKEARE
ncbi:MAG: RDD family protein [Chloroflexota bacterium]